MIKKQGKYLFSLNLSLSLLTLFLIFQFFVSFSTEDKAEQEHQTKITDNYKIFSLSPPTNITFAGEKVPLYEPEVYERLDREIHSNTYFHSNTIMYFKKANRWFPVIEPILAKNNIPNDFKYLALIESGLQNVISPAGATGYWQFLKKTGVEFGLEVNNEVDERYHVEKSTEAACKYLNTAYAIFNDWALVAASYNTGMSRISSELKRQKTDSYYNLLLNNETGRYVFRILAVKHIYENPANYGFNIRKKDLYPPLEFTTIDIDTSISNFADFAQDRNISYKVLKYFNPWLRDSELKNLGRKSYTLKVPTNTNYELN